jgi:hypothetical protein
MHAALVVSREVNNLEELAKWPHLAEARRPGRRRRMPTRGRSSPWRASRRRPRDSPRSGKRKGKVAGISMVGVHGGACGLGKRGWQHIRTTFFFMEY